jgi:Fur family ferric uptake transcriptional regulator
MNRLIAAGLGEEVRTENRAVAYTAGCGSHHHHHLLCRQCRSMVDVQLPSLESSLEQVQRELAEREGFRGIGHELVFLGTCSTCDAHGTKEAGIASQHKNEAACKKDHS